MTKWFPPRTPLVAIFLKMLHNRLMLSEFSKAFLLIFLLNNPFLMIIYLLDLLQDYSLKEFGRVLLRAAHITAVVFVVFAVVGDTIFNVVLQARFASFQIFGGIVFLFIGIRFVFSGPEAMRGLRGNPDQIAGSIAMPIMIGPGTVSASMLVGQRINSVMASLAIVSAVYVCILVMYLLKYLHDFVRPRNERLIERYVETAGRIAAMIVGTFSIEMIMRGVLSWLPEFSAAIGLK